MKSLIKGFAFIGFANGRRRAGLLQLKSGAVKEC